VHRVVVVDEDGQAVGIISSLDALRAIVGDGHVGAGPAPGPRFPSWPSDR
jgi:CBS domain-containing protein